MITNPAPATEHILLRDGYWDRTAVVQMPTGELRVRKISKGDASAGPWGRDNLRAEAAYLRGLESHLKDFFPALLDNWDGDTTGYDMTFQQGNINVGELARRQLFSQSQADAMQDYLAQRVFKQLHTPCDTVPILAANMADTLLKAQACLQQQDDLQCLLSQIVINQRPVSSLDQQLQQLIDSPLLHSFDQQPQVRLHGDMFMENMLLPEQNPGSDWPQHLMLIDPISVAGVGAGHPLFDLGKYLSYATGELPAMRQQRVIVTGFENAKKGQFSWQIDWQDPAMAGFNNVDWHSTMRQAYEQHYGVINASAFALLEAYFAAAMVVCTTGLEQQARALKMRQSLQIALD
jgi:hypothetical protein